MAEPGGVHRRGDDRLPIGVTARPGVAVQQVRDPGQVLGDLPGLPGSGRRRGRFGQHRVAGGGRGLQVGGGELGRDVDDPAAGRIDPGRVGAGELGQPLEQPPGRPGRIGGSGPGARRGGVGSPLLGPHGGDDQVALAWSRSATPASTAAPPSASAYWRSSPSHSTVRAGIPASSRSSSAAAFSG